jgi:hypothetical protein
MKYVLPLILLLSVPANAQKSAMQAIVLKIMGDAHYLGCMTNAAFNEQVTSPEKASTKAKDFCKQATDSFVESVRERMNEQHAIVEPKKGGGIGDQEFNVDTTFGF